MTIAFTSPITGSAQVGLTAPTYTHAADSPPAINGKQVYVTALGGTQTGVNIHSGSCPFTLACYKPAVFRQLGKAHPVTGVIANVPKNQYKVSTVKGVLPLAGQPFQNMTIHTFISVPAGADLADAPNVRAALSAHIGALTQQSSGIGDSAVQGTI